MSVSVHRWTYVCVCVCFGECVIVCPCTCAQAYVCCACAYHLVCESVSTRSQACLILSNDVDGRDFLFLAIPLTYLPVAPLLPVAWRRMPR